MCASLVLRPKKHGGSFGFHAAVANGCVPVDTDGILGDTPSIDSGDPNTDRGTSVPVGTLGATLPSFGGVETLLSTSGSSCASPKCFLRVARPFPNCSSNYATHYGVYTLFFCCVDCCAPKCRTGCIL